MPSYTLPIHERTRVHTLTHTHTHTYINTHMHACMHAHMRTHTLTTTHRTASPLTLAKHAGTSNCPYTSILISSICCSFLACHSDLLFSQRLAPCQNFNNFEGKAQTGKKFTVRVRLGWKPSFPHPQESHHPLGSWRRCSS